MRMEIIVLVVRDGRLGAWATAKSSRPRLVTLHEPTIATSNDDTRPLLNISLTARFRDGIYCVF